MEPNYELVSDIITFFKDVQSEKDGKFIIYNEDDKIVDIEYYANILANSSELYFYGDYGNIMCNKCIFNNNEYYFTFNTYLQDVAVKYENSFFYNYPFEGYFLSNYLYKFNNLIKFGIENKCGGEGDPLDYGFLKKPPPNMEIFSVMDLYNLNPLFIKNLDTLILKKDFNIGSQYFINGITEFPLYLSITKLILDIDTEDICEDEICFDTMLKFKKLFPNLKSVSILDTNQQQYTQLETRIISTFLD